MANNIPILATYHKYFDEYTPQKSLTDGERLIVESALKNFEKWVDVYEQALFTRRSAQNKKDGSIYDINSNEHSENEEITDDMKIILMMNNWFDSLVAVQRPTAKMTARNIRRTTLSKLMKGGFYNKKVYDAIKNSVRRLTLVS